MGCPSRHGRRLGPSVDRGVWGNSFGGQDLTQPPEPRKKLRGGNSSETLCLVKETESQLSGGRLKAMGDMTAEWLAEVKIEPTGEGTLELSMLSRVH